MVYQVTLKHKQTGTLHLYSFSNKRDRARFIALVKRLPSLQLKRIETLVGTFTFNSAVSHITNLYDDTKIEYLATKGLKKQTQPKGRGTEWQLP